MVRQLAPAARIEGGGHQVQSTPLLERGKSEHPPEKAQLTVSDGIRRPQGDAEAVERDRMTSSPLSRED